MRKKLSGCRIIGLLIFYLVIHWNVVPALAGPPPDFEDTLVTVIGRPTGLAFTPDGRLLIATQSGRLRIYQNENLLATSALDLSSVTCTEAERGLLGITVDPNFATNRYIYLYYTFKKFGVCPISNLTPTHPVNRVSRFTLPATNVIDPASERVLVDNIPTIYGYHNAGDLHFGPDGYLYISLGDGGEGERAQDLGQLAGKIIRISKDGSIPNSNPYATTPGSRRCGSPAGVPGGSGPCQEVIAYGLRNPFRFAFKPGTNRFYINDVGQDEWEEINEWPGGSTPPNYGWPIREGPCGRYENPNDCSANPAGLTPPVFYYRHGTTTGLPTDGCGAITGGVFVPPEVWPATYQNRYLFGDFLCEGIFQLNPNGSGGFTPSQFVTGSDAQRVTSMIFGPYANTHALYYLTYQGIGEVRRIVYTGGNRKPLTKLTAQPDYGPVPLSVTFNASGSRDPDNDPISFDWNFGNGTTLTGGTSLTVSHTYTAKGIYTATLVVRDSKGAVSPPAALRIDVGNTPPSPAILFPSATTRFYVGQSLILQGQATDAEDGVLPVSALTWEMALHHLDQHHPDNAHSHPFLPPTPGNNILITTPPPEDLRAAALSYLEIQLTAVDSLGRTGTITQVLEPNRVNLTFISQPPGLTLVINDEPVLTPLTLTSWQGYLLQARAPFFQDYHSGTWHFTSWSDSGSAEHLIITPYLNNSYTAIYIPISAERTLLPMIR